MTRRQDINQRTTIETAIAKIMHAIELMPADPRLTNAVVLLDRAKDWVGDYVDGINADVDGAPDVILRFNLLEFPPST